MTFTIKEFIKGEDEKYIKGIRELCDLTLCPGFMTDSDISNFGTPKYYCGFAVDENDKVVALDYGYYGTKADAMHELRITESEFNKDFKGVESVVVHLGLAVSPDARGNGIGQKIISFHNKMNANKGDICIEGVWVRTGEEKPVINLLNKLGAVYYKTVPEYWHDYEGLYCTLCHGVCHCSCDLYYFTKDGLEND